MLPPNAAKIRSVLRDLPVEARLSELLVSIVETDSKAVAVSKRLLDCTLLMSRWLSDGDRFKLSEAMRDAADNLEKPLIAERRIEIKG
jgi:hypothetical protein